MVQFDVLCSLAMSIKKDLSEVDHENFLVSDSKLHDP